MLHEGGAMSWTKTQLQKRLKVPLSPLGALGVDQHQRCGEWISRAQLRIQQDFQVKIEG